MDQGRLINPEREESIPSESLQDSLTGLPGMETLEILDPTFSVRRPGEVWSALALDLISFKRINDSHGRLIADRVLQQTAYMLSRNVKRSDILIRLREDEFVILMPSTTASQAANVVQRLLEAVQHEQFTNNLRVSFSIGLGESVDHERGLAPVIEKARRALRDTVSGGPGRLRLPASGRRAKPSAPLFDHFVDRRMELKSLRESLDSTITNGLTIVLVSGEAGVGKTKLALELRHYSGFRNCLFTLVNQADSSLLSGIPFFTEPIRTFASNLTPEELMVFSKAVEPVSSSTAALFPGLSLPVAEEGDNHGVVRSIHKDLTCILSALSRCRPLVMVLDDLHEAGHQELEEIAFLSAVAGGARILLVLCVRTSGMNSWHINRLLSIVGSFSGLWSLELTPLSEEHSANSMILALRTHDLHQKDIAALVEGTGGNPLLIEEKLKFLHETGCLSNMGLSIDEESIAAKMPGSIQGVIRKRIERLSGEVRSILRTASLLPGRFDPAQAALVSGGEESSVGSRLNTAVDSGFLTADQGENGRVTYRFAHALFRELMSEELTDEEKQLHFTRLGQHYEREAVSGSLYAERRAAFFHSKGKDRHKAAGPALLAARDAKGRGATREQNEWLELHHELVGDLKITPADRLAYLLELGGLLGMYERHEKAEEILLSAEGYASTPSELAEVNLSLGKLHRAGGELEKAHKCLELVRKCEECPVPGLEASISIALLKHRMGFAAEARELLEEIGRKIASRSAGWERDCLEADFLGVFGVVLSSDGETDKGESLCRRAIERAERCGKGFEHARAIMNLSDALSSSGAWEERHRLLSKSASILRENYDLEGYARALLKLGLIHLSLNQYDAASERLQKSGELAVLIGSSDTANESEFHIGLVEDGRGNPEQALLHFSNSMEKASRLRDERVSFQCCLKAALTLGRLGSSAQARALLKSLERRGTVTLVGLKLHADLLLTQGIVEYLDRDTGGETSLQKALDLLREAGSHYSGRFALSSLEESWYEALCLTQLKGEESASLLVGSSCQSVEMLLDSIESPFIKDDFKKTDYIQGLLDLGKGADPGPNRNTMSSSSSESTTYSRGTEPRMPGDGL